MKVLVTGCLGFIGSNLVPHLLKAGFEVIGFDNRINVSIDPTNRMKANSGDLWQWFKFYDVDIRQLNQMYTICANEKPDYVVHLAALGSVPRSFSIPYEVIDTNETGFCNVLMLASNMACKKMVYASSSSVYGSNMDGRKVEGNEGFPLSPYALTKQQNEKLARIWSTHAPLPTMGLRFFNVYGPGQLPGSPYSAVIPRFITDPVIKINGDGETVRDFTYVDDVCEAIMLAMDEANEAAIGVCNVGTGQGTTINALANMIAMIRPDARERKHVPARAGEALRSIASTEFALQKLGWTAKTELNEGLKRTIEYYEGLKNDKSV